MNMPIIPAATVFLLAIGIASAVDPPDVKEGLWSIQRHNVDNPGNKISDSKSTICRSHAYDQHVNGLTKNVKECTTVSQSSQGGKYSSKTRCVVAGTTIESEGTSTFLSDTSTHSESHATYSPAMGGISETTMIVDQKYLGSCPAGVQPGDMTNANGTVTHLWKH
ncbi:MAG: DUF3617 family protein [Bryobacteraceae bacterium]|jgi:hypothetical protein